jgi:hypothetical protein
MSPAPTARPRAALWPAAALLAVASACGSDPASPGGGTYPAVVALAFDQGPSGAADVTLAWSDSASAYLDSLRAHYPPSTTLPAGATTDYARVQAVSRWVRGRWEHNGDNVAAPGDPISVLQQAARGQRFRCVEYAVVLAGVLQSVGVRARVLGLKTADVETRATGAGHVVAEAWLREQGRWVMVDGQWDAIPTLDGQPLDAVAFQRALAARAPGLGVTSLSRTDPAAYFAWVGPYLHYFDVRRDQRLGVATGAEGVMLVPLGAPRPTRFQRTGSLGPLTYTHSVADFYAPPGSTPAPAAP